MSDRLNQRQRLAALLLAGGLGTSQVAKMVGVHPGTIRRWRKRPAFKEAVEAEGVELAGEVRRGFSELSTYAFRVLLDLLGSDNDAVSLRAALQILDRVGLGRLKPIPLDVTDPPKIVVEYMTPDGLPYSYQLREEILRERAEAAMGDPSLSPGECHSYDW